MENILDFFSTIYGLADKFISAPWFTQLILLFYSLVFLGVVAVILVYVFLKLSSIYAFIYLHWYLPSFYAITQRRMKAQGYSKEQIKAFLTGNAVGRPVKRDRSKDVAAVSEEEKCFDEIEDLNRQLAELNDPNSEASKKCRLQAEQWQAFMEENPDYIRDAALHIVSGKHRGRP